MTRWLECVCLISLLWVSAFGKSTKYTNQWIVNIHGGEEVAQRVARDLGYTYKEQITPFDDHYLLIHNELPEISLRDSSHLTNELQDLKEVKWAEQQAIPEVSKRGYLPEYKKRSPTNVARGFFGSSSKSDGSSSSNDPVNPKEVGKGNFRSIKKDAFPTKPTDDSQLKDYQGVTKHIKCLSSKSSAYEEVFNDPMWHSQWYVQDYRVQNTPVMDHNVVPVYKKGYTGKDIVVMIPDDGIQHDHIDLEGNLDLDLSYDYCEDKPGCEPDNSQFASGARSEGTMCAGVLAMVANNRRCGVGIAYHAKVAGAKIFCKQYSADRIAKGLVHQLPAVHIYSISWGAADNGRAMKHLTKMSATALDKGITEGRKGKGAIYVVTCGNGKHSGDNCAADPIPNHVGSIVIANANQLGKSAYYSERCTSILATAYSGQQHLESVVTTTDNGGCSSSGVGSISAAPIASGIIALALDANDDLTYRDVMHLIVMSSEVAPLADNGEDCWYKNGKGFWVSNDFGFGLLNAENMVNLAKHWDKVPKEHICIEENFVKSTQFNAQEGFQYILNTKACDDKHNEVKYLEHIVFTSTIKFPYRGAISIEIKSPKGTKSTLLEVRPNDNDPNGLISWPIKSVHNWGENPRGQWTINVKIANVKGLMDTVAVAEDFTLTFHGTEDKPHHYKHDREYAAFRLPDGRDSTL